MLKIVSAVIWLGVNAYSLVRSTRNRQQVRDFLAQLRGGALALFLGGLLVELILYGMVTVSFQHWGELAFGALVIAVHLQLLLLLVLLAARANNKQWSTLTTQKLQAIIVPSLGLEVVWLAYLVAKWTGLTAYLF